MIAKKVNRYYSDCGKGWWSKQKAIKHDENCKCWQNPKFKSCLSCKFKNFITDSNGMEHEPQFLQTWKSNECLNKEMDFNTMQPAHENAPELAINCKHWQLK